MSNLTSVGITDGVPTSGTGTVSTLDALIALVGALTDAKNSATDTTPVSVISILKEVSAMVQALGATTDAKNTATDGTAVTAISILKEISAMVQAPPSQVVTNVKLTDAVAGLYEKVAASQTAQVLGGSGAIGDYISSVLVIPATVSPGVVTLLDNATSIPLFAGGTSSLSNLVPFLIPLGMYSVSGAWKLTTGADLSCVAVGKFT